MPASLPTKIRPPATLGWARAELVSPNPKAHFTLSFGTSAAVIPAAAVFWKRVFSRSTPHLIHWGPFKKSRTRGAAASQNALAGGGVTLGAG